MQLLTVVLVHGMYIRTVHSTLYNLQTLDPCLIYTETKGKKPYRISGVLYYLNEQDSVPMKVLVFATSFFSETMAASSLLLSLIAAKKINTANSLSTSTQFLRIPADEYARCTTLRQFCKFRETFWHCVVPSAQRNARTLHKICKIISTQYIEHIHLLVF